MSIYHLPSLQKNSISAFNFPYLINMQNLSNLFKIRTHKLQRVYRFLFATFRGYKSFSIGFAALLFSTEVSHHFSIERIYMRATYIPYKMQAAVYNRQLLCIGLIKYTHNVFHWVINTQHCRRL